MMRSLKLALLLTGLYGMLGLASLARAEDNAAVAAMAEYLEFVDYGGATIFPEQIPADDWKSIFVIDARDAGQLRHTEIGD